MSLYDKLKENTPLSSTENWTDLSLEAKIERLHDYMRKSIAFLVEFEEEIFKITEGVREHQHVMRENKGVTDSAVNLTDAVPYNQTIPASKVKDNLPIDDGKF